MAGSLAQKLGSLSPGLLPLRLSWSHLCRSTSSPHPTQQLLQCFPTHNGPGPLQSQLLA
ncbi:hypothetical protein I79_010712 [Cricetulus griseus]|uniref:Uncharacterized protein n=1 Tax=Cricetulus griseus TaxID=10029 RepID=G3HJ78_CRIGR|nr:hypothetical protein I79_010712 [Cricetulus griseus]